MIDAFDWALTQEEHKDLSLEEITKRYLNHEKLIPSMVLFS